MLGGTSSMAVDADLTMGQGATMGRQTIMLGAMMLLIESLMLRITMLIVSWCPCIWGAAQRSTHPDFGKLKITKMAGGSCAPNTHKFGSCEILSMHQDMLPPIFGEIMGAGRLSAKLKNLDLQIFLGTCNAKFPRASNFKLSVPAIRS